MQRVDRYDLLRTAEKWRRLGLESQAEKCERMVRRDIYIELRQEGFPKENRPAEAERRFAALRK